MAAWTGFSAGNVAGAVRTLLNARAERSTALRKCAAHLESLALRNAEIALSLVMGNPPLNLRRISESLPCVRGQTWVYSVVQGGETVPNIKSVKKDVINPVKIICAIFRQVRDEDLYQEGADACRCHGLRSGADGGSRAAGLQGDRQDGRARIIHKNQASGASLA